MKVPFIALALFAALNAHPLLACGPMAEVDLEENAEFGVPTVDLVGAKIRTPSENLTPEQVSEVARGNMYQVQACYEDLVRRRPEAAGFVVATVRLDASGAVEDAAVNVRDMKRDKAFTACVAANVGGWRFPKPKGQGNLKASIVFRAVRATQSQELPTVQNALAGK